MGSAATVPSALPTLPMIRTLAGAVARAFAVRARTLATAHALAAATAANTTPVAWAAMSLRATTAWTAAIVTLAAAVGPCGGISARLRPFAAGATIAVGVGGGVGLCARAVAVGARFNSHVDRAFVGADGDFSARTGLTVARMGAGAAREREREQSGGRQVGEPAPARRASRRLPARVAPARQRRSHQSAGTA